MAGKWHSATGAREKADWKLLAAHREHWLSVYYFLSFCFYYYFVVDRWVFRSFILVSWIYFLVLLYIIRIADYNSASVCLDSTSSYIILTFSLPRVTNLKFPLYPNDKLKWRTLLSTAYLHGWETITLPILSTYLIALFEFLAESIKPLLGRKRHTVVTMWIHSYLFFFFYLRKASGDV